jgi:hypothetical protein
MDKICTSCGSNDLKKLSRSFTLFFGDIFECKSCRHLDFYSFSKKTKNITYLGILFILIISTVLMFIIINTPAVPPILLPQI